MQSCKALLIIKGFKMATSNVIAHKNLTDPQLHEPKGIATATEDTVYIADGNGSGSWQSLPFSYLDYSAPAVVAVNGYQNIGTVTNVDYTVLTPVVTGAVTDANIPLGSPVDRDTVNTALATVNKNSKEIGTEVAQLRTEIIKAFDNTAALKACLEDLRTQLIAAGIIVST